MTTAPAPLPTPEQERADAERALDEALLSVESAPEGRILAHSKNGPLLNPREQRVMEALESRGYLKQEMHKHISVASGIWAEMTYELTPLGRVHTHELRLKAAETK